jgi:hypothetical protein
MDAGAAVKGIASRPPISLAERSRVVFGSDVWNRSIVWTIRHVSPTAMSAQDSPNRWVSEHRNSGRGEPGAGATRTASRGAAVREARVQNRSRSRRHHSRCDVARLAFIATASLVAALGVATSIWLSRATVRDWFVFGDTQLWSAMDPAGLYLPDVILFFEPDPVSLYFHPGLPMTFMGASIAKSWYLVHSAISDTEPYVDYWVRRRILLNGLLASTAVVTLLACCHPLFLVLRRFMDRWTAYVACTVFLAPVPTLLWVGRFSPEVWMLYFLFWSIHLGLRVLEGDIRVSTRLALGAATALAVLSKVLVLPVLAFSLYSLMAARRGAANRRVAGIAWFALGAVIAGGPLLLKLPILTLVDRLGKQLYYSGGVESLSALFNYPNQRPFLAHHALVFTLGTVGLAVMYGAMRRSRKRLVPLAATILVMVLVALKRPYWHYFFGFYWLFPIAATCGLAIILRRFVSLRRQQAAVAAGLLIIGICNAWWYPGIVATYRQYRNVFHQREMLVRERPAWVPAPWEWSWGDFELTQDPAKVTPFFGARLDPILQKQRQAEAVEWARE